MPSRAISVSLLLLATQAMLACSVVRQRPEQSLRTDTQIAALECTFDLKKLITEYNRAGASEDTKRGARDTIIDSGLILIDVRYEEFVNDFATNKKGMDSGTEIAAIGLNTAGALLTPATTVRILSALSAGAIASNASINKNYFYGKSIQAMVRQMSASRQQMLVPLLKGRTLPTEAYSLGQALADLRRYYEAGTFEGAFDSIAKDAAIKENTADRSLDALQQDALDRLNAQRTRGERWQAVLKEATPDEYRRHLTDGIAQVWSDLEPDEPADAIWIYMRDPILGFTNDEINAVFSVPDRSGLQDPPDSVNIEAFLDMMKAGELRHRITLGRILETDPKLPLP